MIPVLVACLYGFLHAFEADHLLAVAGIISSKNNPKSALKEGVLWAVGHSATIVCFAVLIKIFYITFQDLFFTSFEAVVGIMLILIGSVRVKNYFNGSNFVVKAQTTFALSTGVVHGLAGSGSLLVLLLPGSTFEFDSIVVLLVFAAGTIIGMGMVAFILFLPFYKKYHQSLPVSIQLLSGLLCIIYGFYVFGSNSSELF